MLLSVDDCLFATPRTYSLNQDEEYTSRNLSDYGDGNAFSRHLENPNGIPQLELMENLDRSWAGSAATQHEAFPNLNSPCVSDLQGLELCEGSIHRENESLPRPYGTDPTLSLPWTSSTENFQLNSFEAGYAMPLPQPSNYSDSAPYKYSSTLGTHSSSNVHMLPSRNTYSLDEGGADFNAEGGWVGPQEGGWLQPQSFSATSHLQGQLCHDLNDLKFPSDASYGLL